MFKKTIKFETFNGEEVERDFYFHLSKSELLAMANEADSMQERVKRIQATNDVRAVIAEFRAIVEMSVGVRSEDGERFVKDIEAQSSLLASPAFDELLFELVNTPNAAVEFIKQLIPEKLQQELQEQMKIAAENASDPAHAALAAGIVDDPRPAWIRENREPTPAELRTMSHAELSAAFLARNREQQ